MTRKRFIKLLMATGNYDRNHAVKVAQLNYSSNNQRSYTSMYKACLDFSEAMGLVRVACDYIVESLYPALVEAAEGCKGALIALQEVLADSKE